MRILIFIFFLINFLSCSSVQSLSEGLLIYYPCNGNADDLSGNGLNGQTKATPAKDRFGNPNNALSFNGENQYIELPNIKKLKPNLPVSFSFWVKFNDLDVSNTVIFTTDFATDKHSGVWMNVSSGGKLAINFGNATGMTTSNHRRTKIGRTSIKKNNWYQVIGIIKENKEMELYINCENDGGFYEGKAQDLRYSNKSGSIGRKDVGRMNPYYFDGVLDDFRYWEKELKMEEIEKLCKDSKKKIIKA